MKEEIRCPYCNKEEEGAFEALLYFVDDYVTVRCGGCWGRYILNWNDFYEIKNYEDE
jgi:predicted metal-binding protein